MVGAPVPQTESVAQLMRQGTPLFARSSKNAVGRSIRKHAIAAEGNHQVISRKGIVVRRRIEVHFGEACGTAQDAERAATVGNSDPIGLELELVGVDGCITNNRILARSCSSRDFEDFSSSGISVLI